MPLLLKALMAKKTPVQKGSKLKFESGRTFWCSIGYQTLTHLYVLCPADSR